jgi:predicted TIM-barrel fold metal-dependent hydrolase
MPDHVPFAAVDADNHYYESRDAFIRHIEPAMTKRCMQWATIDGRQRLLVGGKVNRFIPNPTWDPIARPGSLDAYFRGKNDKGEDVKTMFGALDPLAEHPEYQDRVERLKVMDAQGLDAAYFFPTLAVGMQQSLAHDLPALVAAFTAFNRWLDEDWGFAFDQRIYAAPVITLADPAAAVAEVEWCLARGARLLCMVPGPVPCGDGTTRSPAHPVYDPVWARIDEAGVTVGIHGGDGGMGDYIRQWEAFDEFQAFVSTPFRLVVMHERQISDTFAALICHGLFDRFPRLRLASIENGGSFVPKLLDELADVYGKMPQAFGRHPVEAFQEHVWVSPYYEDDIVEIAARIGTDHLLFGSDWPHAEGLAEPTMFVTDIPSFSDSEVRAIMRDNALALLQPA